MEVIKLSKEYQLGKKTYEEINLDLESLTGLQLIKAETEYKAKNRGSVMKELEDGWYILIASKSSGINYNDLLKLSAKDFVKIVNTVRVFLMNTDSEEEKIENIEEETIEE